jgi:hypothetical protein
MKFSTILQRARQILINDGWCQGDMYNHKGAHCALGAISAVDANVPSNWEISPLSYVTPGSSIAGWNDEIDRTLEDVLKAFDEATSLAMSEESCLDVSSNFEAT